MCTDGVAHPDVLYHRNRNRNSARLEMSYIRLLRCSTQEMLPGRASRLPEKFPVFVSMEMESQRRHSAGYCSEKEPSEGGKNVPSQRASRIDGASATATIRIQNSRCPHFRATKAAQCPAVSKPVPDQLSRPDLRDFEESTG